MLGTPTIQSRRTRRVKDGRRREDLARMLVLLMPKKKTTGVTSLCLLMHIHAYSIPL